MSKIKKIKRNALFGGPIEEGDENNPEYKVMECTSCGRKMIMLQEDWDKTKNPEKLPKFCLVCGLLKRAFL
jgi:hypothetical protein